MQWLVRQLVARTGPSTKVWLALVATLLALPSLAAPMFADDFMQARKLAPHVWGAPFPLGRTGIHGAFDFVSPRGGGIQEAVSEGFLAWWTTPDFQLSFWRPLSALTHQLDYTIWPHHVWLMHVHTLVWQLGLFAVVAVLFARLLGPREAVLAFALYALDDARAITAGFLANRNALLAGIFGLVALLLHQRCRSSGTLWALPASLLALAMGLLSAELALTATAWMFAFAVCLDRGPLTRRALSLVPATLVVVGWKVVYSAMGFGVSGSGVYVHPLSSPVLFGQRLLERAPQYALGQLTFIPSDLGLGLPGPVSLGLSGLGVVLLVGVGWALRDLLRERPEVRFFALGSALSLVPICGVFASDRNLTFVSVGASALLAIVLVRHLDTPRVGWRGRVLSGLVAVHLVWAPLLVPVRGLTTLGADHFLERVVPVDAPDLPERTAVFIWVSTDAWPGFGRVRAVSVGSEAPRRGVALVMSEGAATVERVDDRTLHIAVDRFGALEMQQMARGPHRPFEVGETVALPDVQITVEAVDADGRPAVLRAVFAVSIDDPRLMWQLEDEGTFPLWTPPAVGETVTVGGMPWG